MHVSPPPPFVGANALPQIFKNKRGRKERRKLLGGKVRRYFSLILVGNNFVNEDDVFETEEDPAPTLDSGA